MSFVKTMRLVPRSGGEEKREIGGFKEEERGYRVVDCEGNDLGYFGPDRYESIVFEVWWSGSTPDGDTTGA